MGCLMLFASESFSKEKIMGTRTSQPQQNSGMDIQVLSMGKFIVFYQKQRYGIKTFKNWVQ